MTSSATNTMGVKVSGAGSVAVRICPYTQYALIYYSSLDRPTKECEAKWRAFENKFFDEACKPTGRSKNDVFMDIAETEIIPGTQIRDWKIGGRHTVVLIDEAELKWLVTFGIDALKLIDGIGGLMTSFISSSREPATRKGIGSGKNSVDVLRSLQEVVKVTA